MKLQIIVLAMLIPSISHALKIEDTDFSSILEQSSPVNPIFGLSVYLQGQQFLLNLYEYGNADHPLIKTVRNLFFKNSVNEQLRPNDFEGNIAHGLTPFLIGWLLSIVTNPPASFKKTSYESLVKNCKKNSKLSIKDNSFNEFVNVLNETYKKRVSQNHPSREKNKIRDLSRKKLFELLDQAIEAHHLGNGEIYDQTLVPLLFNTYACAKSKNKKDMYSFAIDGFISHTNQPKLHSKNVIMDESTLQKFLCEKTSKKQVENIIEPYSGTLALCSKLPKTIIYPGTAYLLYQRPILEKISLQYITDFNETPDCTEAAILHLIASILFNNNSNKFDLKTLPQKLKQSTFIKKLCTFLTKNDLNDPLFRKKWFCLLSNRPCIHYEKDGFAVAARASNIFRLTNQLLGLNTTTWSTLGKELSSDDSTITISGPSDVYEPYASTITFKKTYKNKNYYYSTIIVDYDMHAGIGESKFELASSPLQNHNLYFSKKLLEIGLSPLLFSLIAPLTPQDVQQKIFLHKKENILPLCIALSKNIPRESFWGLSRIIKDNPKIKNLINLSNINPDPNNEIDQLTTDWLLQTKAYKDEKAWDGILNSPEIFIERALLTEKFEAIHYLINDILDSRCVKSSPLGIRVLRALWNNIITEYSTINPPENYKQFKIVIPKNAAYLTYRFNQQKMDNLFYDLIKKEGNIIPRAVKLLVLEDAIHTGTLIKKLINYDLKKGETDNIFYDWNPHTLYLLLITAIQDPNEKNREACLQILLSDPQYLEATIRKGKNIVDLIKNDPFGRKARNQIEKDRAKSIRKELVANYKNYQR